jgi:hypothetical protein
MIRCKHCLATPGHSGIVYPCPGPNGHELESDAGGMKSMEKYGVEQGQKEKTGADGKPATKCPLCGADLDTGGACPTHGTEPFEKKPEPEEKK